MPAHLVSTISIPGKAPAVEIRLPSFAFPIPVTVITGWFTAFVTSVWPPAIWTLAFSQASSACCIISLISGSVISGGSRTDSKTPKGSAPAEARSFRFTKIASSPISFTVPVMGSVESTKTSSSLSFIAAQSSPTPAPRIISSRFVCICLKTERFNTLSGNFPVFMKNSCCIQCKAVRKRQPYRIFNCIFIFTIISWQN